MTCAPSTNMSQHVPTCADTLILACGCMGSRFTLSVAFTAMASLQYCAETRCKAYLAVQGDPRDIGVGRVEAVCLLGVHQLQVVTLTALVAAVNLVPVHRGQSCTLLGHNWVLFFSVSKGTVQERPKLSPGQEWVVIHCLSCTHRHTHTRTQTHTHTHIHTGMNRVHHTLHLAMLAL